MAVYRREVSLKVNLYGADITARQLDRIAQNISDHIEEELRCDVPQFMNVSGAEVEAVNARVSVSGFRRYKGYKDD